MKKVEINGKYITHLPTKWTELTRKQLKSLCRLTLTAADHTTLKVMLVLSFANLAISKRNMIIIDNEMHHWFYSRKTGNVLLPNAVMQIVSNTLNFLFTVRKKKHYLESQLYLQRFPYFVNRFFRKLHGPDSALFNITWLEFMKLETTYSQMGEDPEAINRLAGILYRTGNRTRNSKTGDKRIEYNDFDLPKYTRRAKRLRAWQLLYIRLFYEGCRAYIIQRHPHAFGDGGTPSEPKPLIQAFNELTNALTSNDPTKAETIRKTRLWDILPAMEQNAKTAKELKEKTK